MLLAGSPAVQPQRVLDQDALARAVLNHVESDDAFDKPPTIDDVTCPASIPVEAGPGVRVQRRRRRQQRPRLGQGEDQGRSGRPVTGLRNDRAGELASIQPSGRTTCAMRASLLLAAPRSRPGRVCAQGVRSPCGSGTRTRTRRRVRRPGLGPDTPTELLGRAGIPVGEDGAPARSSSWSGALPWAARRSPASSASTTPRGSSSAGGTSSPSPLTCGKGWNRLLLS